MTAASRVDLIVDDPAVADLAEEVVAPLERAGLDDLYDDRGGPGLPLEPARGLTRPAGPCRRRLSVPGWTGETRQDGRDSQDDGFVSCESHRRT